MCPFFSGILWQANVRGLNQYIALAWFLLPQNSQNGTGKSWKSWLLSVLFWLCLSFLSGANTVEADYPGIPRSINMGITCPAMQRLVFEGGGHFVRLSANSCQLHRPNTIPIFCAAVCRDYRLRTCSGVCLYIAISHPRPGKCRILSNTMPARRRSRGSGGRLPGCGILPGGDVCVRWLRPRGWSW